MTPLLLLPALALALVWVERLRSRAVCRNRKLEALIVSLTDRVEKQSSLLAKRAERTVSMEPVPKP